MRELSSAVVQAERSRHGGFPARVQAALARRVQSSVVRRGRGQNRLEHVPSVEPAQLRSAGELASRK